MQTLRSLLENVTNSPSNLLGQVGIGLKTGTSSSFVSFIADLLDVKSQQVCLF